MTACVGPTWLLKVHKVELVNNFVHGAKAFLTTPSNMSLTNPNEFIAFFQTTTLPWMRLELLCRLGYLGLDFEGRRHVASDKARKPRIL